MRCMPREGRKAQASVTLVTNEVSHNPHLEQCSFAGNLSGQSEPSIGRGCEVVPIHSGRRTHLPNDEWTANKATNGAIVNCAAALWPHHSNLPRYQISYRAHHPQYRGAGQNSDPSSSALLHITSREESTVVRIVECPALDQVPCVVLGYW